MSKMMRPAESFSYNDKLFTQNMGFFRKNNPSSSEGTSLLTTHNSRVEQDFSRSLSLSAKTFLNKVTGKPSAPENAPPEDPIGYSAFYRLAFTYKETPPYQVHQEGPMDFSKALDKVNSYHDGFSYLGKDSPSIRIVYYYPDNHHKIKDIDAPFDVDIRGFAPESHISFSKSHPEHLFKEPDILEENSERPEYPSAPQKTFALTFK